MPNADLGETLLTRWLSKISLAWDEQGSIRMYFYILELNPVFPAATSGMVDGQATYCAKFHHCRAKCNQ